MSSETLQSTADSIAGRFTRVFERHMWNPFVEAGLPADQVRPLTESLQRLSALAEDVMEVTLRDALRRKAGDFLAEQASRLDEAGVLDGLSTCDRDHEVPAGAGYRRGRVPGGRPSGGSWSTCGARPTPTAGQ
jgi:hypothetical protein